MVQYICPRCKYISNNKSDVKRHFNGKEMCNVVEGGIHINVKECQNVLLGKIDPLEYLLMKTKLEEIQLKLEEIQLKYNNNIYYNNCQIDNSVNDNSVNDNSVNIQIVINPYNEPNTEYILSKHCDAALSNGNLVEGCIQMARLIWFNGNHPENHSIFKTNKKDNSVKCIENGKINEYTLNSKFQKIMEVVLNTFERSEKESERYYDLNDIFDNPEKHSKFFSILEHDLSKELYNHKDLVKSTIAKIQNKIK